MISRFFATAVTILLAGSAHAALVQIEIRGQVDFNQINSGEFADVVSGDMAVLSFQVDSEVFTDGMYPTRGYNIIESSYNFTVGSANVGIADPAPAGETPYFVLRNDDPAVDGFFVGTTVDGFPNGVATDEPGVFGPFRSNFSVTYDNDPLASLDILSAFGVYDFDGLTVFGFTVDDGPFGAMEIVFSSMTISQVPIPAAVWLFGTAVVGLFGVGRHKRVSSAS